MNPPAPALWQRPPIATLLFAATWCTMVISGIVYFEPAPFDLAIIAILGLAFVFGLKLPLAAAPMIVTLVVLLILGLIGSAQTDQIEWGAFYMVTTGYLSLMAMFVASLVAAEPGRALPLIMSGYTIAALIATAAGIAGLFNLVPGGADLFTLSERARGTFEDPNVFGPFLVPPLLYLAVRALRAPTARMIWFGGLAAFLAAGVLLSFSRGAWGVTIVSLALTVFMVLATASGHRVRTRVLVSCVILVALALTAGSFVLANAELAKLFTERFSLVQSYDVSGQGRFASQSAALEVIMERPLGIGPTAFSDWWGLEPHNVYIKSLLIGGWAGGIAYLFLVVSTVIVAFNQTLRPSPYRDLAIVLFASFLAIALEGMVIDTDHWRHFYVLAGLIWGLRAALARMPMPASAPALTRTPLVAGA